MSDATFAGSCAIAEAAQNADRASSATPVVTRIEHLIADSPFGLSRVCCVWKLAAEPQEGKRGQSRNIEPPCARRTLSQSVGRDNARRPCARRVDEPGR